jgi:beta-1,4-mannosyltransferase
VLLSFPTPKPTTNPYVKQLAEALVARPELEVGFFNRYAAMFGKRYDVFHVHWPEALLEARTPLRRLYRRVTTAMLLARFWVTGTRVVRTWHNLERPSDLSRADHLLLDVFDRLTVLRIRLNDSGPMPADAPYVTIPHGHYRDWYARFERESPQPGRLVFVGLVRRYKGVEQLIEAFRAVDDASLSLRIAGMPSTSELAEVITGLAGGDPRISTHLAFLDETEYVGAVTGSELVVLPYRHMHNSGSVLAALSLDRPVLVPDNEVNRRLADEVGARWIHFYRDEILPQDIEETSRRLREEPVQGSPDLDARGWDGTGAAHLEAYRRALGQGPAVTEPGGARGAVSSPADNHR